jgi:DNA-binding MarR family transcriptional regulator
MHAIFFGMKRAYQGALRVTRRPLLSLGLTAARFDLMYALLERDPIGGACGVRMLQSELRGKLGVCASVVSRMLKSLEALGLVTRRRPEYGDRRQRELSLTERGRACIRNAYQALMRAVRRLVNEAICFGKHRDADRCFVHVATLESYLSEMRGQYADRATLYYSWGHPDD